MIVSLLLLCFNRVVFPKEKTTCRNVYRGRISVTCYDVLEQHYTLIYRDEWSANLLEYFVRIHNISSSVEAFSGVMWHIV